MNERIRKIRKVKGMSQAEFGKAIGLSQRSVSEIEVGSNAITERNFDAICKAFSVNPDWLRNGVGEMFIESRDALVASVVAEYGLTEDDAVLIRTYLDLTPEQRAGVMAYIKKFAANMAAQMGLPPLEDEKPDYELSPDEAAEIIRQERAAQLAAEKRGTATSLASIGTSGMKKKIGNSS